MATAKPIIKQVDHIIIRVDNSSSDQLFALFSDTFHLPVAWPLASYTSFVSGGIFAGNVNLELLTVDSQPAQSSHTTTHAHLYGLAFEPCLLPECLQELTQRALPYLPPIPYLQKNATGEQVTVWTNVFLGNLLGSNLWMKAFFILGKMLPSWLWTRASSITPGSTRGVTIVFDHVYRDGMILLCEYNKELHDVEQARAADHATLDSRQGGPLGLEAIQEIIVGVTDLAAVEPRWQILLAPTAPSSPGFWQIGKGPAIRLIRHARNGLQALVWKVASLEQAKQFLSEKGLLGTVLEQQITIAPSKVQGLDIRLVEGAK
jgi:hypothetical protein